ncbi:MAG: AcrR family transcriptional regulator [Phycisphaerales bacterium]|jgi:AcrR family transcriptional regulator
MPPSRRQDLIDTALSLFMAQGYHATGIDRILKESGVSRMTLYNHFKSKDELILATLQHRHETLEQDLDSTLADCDCDPIERLLAVFDYHTAWLTSPEFHGCAFVNAAAEFPSQSCEIRGLIARHKRSVVARLCREATAAGLDQPESLAQRLNLILEGAIAAAMSTDSPCGSDPEALSAADAASHAKAAAEILIERAFEAPAARL